jgi:hypothetical protein
MLSTQLHNTLRKYTLNLMFKKYVHIIKVIIFEHTVGSSLLVHLKYILVLYKMILQIASWNLI